MRIPAKDKVVVQVHYAPPLNKRLTAAMLETIIYELVRVWWNR